MKILVVNASYLVSGVSLAQTRFAAALARAGHEVTFMVGRPAPGLSVPIHDGVTNIVLDNSRTLGMTAALYRHLRKERPDIIFSAEDHLNTLVLMVAIAARSNAKISGSSRVTPFDTYSNRPFTKRWVLKQLARATAWRADALTCVSDDMVKQYRSIFPRGKHECVYNIVDDTASRVRLLAPVDDPWITDAGQPLLMAVGGLHSWKAFDDLIEAAAILRDRCAPFRLAIIGEGPMRPELQLQIERLGLVDRVHLLGRKSNPLAYFRHADISVLTSTVEGMPNVMVEAMLAGCTPVATDCPTGPRELLKGGKYGYLAEVGSPTSIADAIEKALAAPIAPTLLAEALAPFEETRVIARHFQLLGLAARI
nr:glycosyltransferase [uncultured Sphingomonas sp.]